MRLFRLFLRNRLPGLLVGGGLIFFWFLPILSISGADLPIDGFSQDVVGEFPQHWRTYPFQMGKAKRVYKIAEEGGRKFLRAVDEERLSVTIFRGFKWDLQKYPYLKFRWRAQQLPKVATGEKRPVNDHACGVYVGFGRSSALKYVWSSAMAEGSYWAKDPGSFVIISAQYGPSRVGQWNSVTVNVPVDYEKYLSKPVSKNPSGIAVLTDGDNSKQTAACDYADFRVSDQP